MSGSHAPRTVAILAGRSPSERYSLHSGYVDSVSRTGAFPLVLPVGAGIDRDLFVDQVLACDVLLVSGGVDVDPKRSRIADPADAVDADPDRDELEIVAIRAAISAGRRVLGICRGIQILAVAFGGSLIGDLGRAGHPGHDQTDRQYDPVHSVTAVSGSMAATVLGDIAVVNSAHHQAVAEPGDGLVVSARSGDGVIEAIEAPDVLGVQWHPERLSSRDARHLAPFEWLVS